MLQLISIFCPVYETICSLICNGCLFFKFCRFSFILDKKLLQNILDNSVNAFGLSVCTVKRMKHAVYESTVIHIFELEL